VAWVRRCLTAWLPIGRVDRRMKHPAGADYHGSQSAGQPQGEPHQPGNARSAAEDAGVAGVGAALHDDADTGE
jgi:hypothetical protein